MDPPPKLSDEFIQPKKSNKSFVSNKSRNIKKNLKKNSSKGTGRAKSVGDLDDASEGMDSMEGVENGIEDTSEDPLNSKGVSQMNSVGNVSGGMVDSEGSFDVVNGSKVADVGKKEACSTTKVSNGKNSNVNVSNIDVEMPVPVHLNPVLNPDLGVKGLIMIMLGMLVLVGLWIIVEELILAFSLVRKFGHANDDSAKAATTSTYTRNTLSFASALQGMVDNGSNKLRLIASRIGTPILMDRITTSMCENAFGRATFARVLVEVDAAKRLPGCIEVCYKSLGRSMSLGVEYAWSPPVCSHCKGFGHSFEACTKRELTEVEVAKMNEINAQNAQKTNSEMNANDTWRIVSYKKVVNNGIANVSMVEEHEVGNSVEGGNVPSNNIDVLKNKILDLERKIMEGNRSIGSTANRKAKEMVAERIMKTRQAGNVAHPGLFDEMYRAELDRIKGLTSFK
ncbi:zinc knuckle CX2CX4HX4C [Artemisia annua]|uniref:Zinc knuckle CX2CX4HX4C n=1 Tax=Artemisia annua TaxID=35608 RepID=A0A2U1LMU3_ARTAN|nr:zinc knuckle CX2CX4HX4C [Artemisia annua]